MILVIYLSIPTFVLLCINRKSCFFSFVFHLSDYLPLPSNQIYSLKFIHQNYLSYISILYGYANCHHFTQRTLQVSTDWLSKYFQTAFYQKNYSKIYAMLITLKLIYTTSLENLLNPVYWCSI